MALPSNVTFGTVVGTFLLAVADYPDDADRDPQGIPASDLKIQFSPNLTPAVAKDATATPPTFFALQNVLATVGPDGSLLGPDGAPGVRLVASTNPALEPHGWTWQVTLSGTGYPTINFSFPLDPGATIDLATVLPVPANPGSTLNAWLQAVADASAARDAAIAAAAAVPSPASLAATYLALPSGTKTAGYAPVVQSNGSVAWAAVSASGGSGGSSAALGADGNYYLASGTGAGAASLGADGNYYLAA